MYAATLFLSLLASTISLVSATTLNYKLEANEKACFYAQVEQVDAKVAFYFAVRNRSFFHLHYERKPFIYDRWEEAKLIDSSVLI